MTYGAFHSIAPSGADTEMCGFVPAPYGVEPDHIVIGEGAVMFAMPQSVMAPPPMKVTEETARLIDDETRVPLDDAALGWSTAPRTIETTPLVIRAPVVPLAPAAPIADAASDIAAMPKASAFQRSDIVAEAGEPPRSAPLDPASPNMPPVDLTLRPSETELRWVPPTRKQVAIRTAVTQGPLYLLICFISYGLYLAYTEYKDDLLAELDPTLVTTMTADAGSIAADEPSTRPLRPLIVIPESPPETENAEQLATPERLIAPEAAAEIDTANADDATDSQTDIALAEIRPDAPAPPEATDAQTAALSAGLLPEQATDIAPADTAPAIEVDSAELAEAEISPEPLDSPLEPAATSLAALSQDGDTSAPADSDLEERSVIYDEPKLRISPSPLPRPGTQLAEAGTEEVPDTVTDTLVERAEDAPPSAIAEAPTEAPAEVTAIVDTAETAATEAPENPAMSAQAGGIDDTAEPKTVSARADRLLALPASAATPAETGTEPELALGDLNGERLGTGEATTTATDALVPDDDAGNADLEPIEIAALDTGTPEDGVPDEEVVFSAVSPRAAPLPLSRP
ncbi:MAG: hypothetical protein AAF367_07370 [Pseudomonadota bacterium]